MQLQPGLLSVAGQLKTLPSRHSSSGWRCNSAVLSRQCGSIVSPQRLSLASQIAAGSLVVGTARVVQRRHRRRRDPRHRLAATAVNDPQSVSKEELDDAFDDVLDGYQDEDFAMQEQQFEPAVVIEVKEHLVIMRCGLGLEVNRKPGAIVRFADGARGILLVWKESIGIVQLINGEISAGDSVVPTAEMMVTKADRAMRGRILSPSGNPIDGLPEPPGPPAVKLTFADFKGMQERTNQYRPCFTGVLGVDFSAPVGRGQTMMFQGTSKEKDKQHLWPDLMSIKPSQRAAGGPDVCVCVCESIEEAGVLRQQLEERGRWDDCVIFVPDSPGIGGAMIAMNAAVAFAEHMNDLDGEATVVLDLEPMHKIWNVLAVAAGEERRSKGIMDDPTDNTWTEFEGTVLRESISERRKFWFALISRATNSVDGGSVSLLTWLWEQEGGREHREQKAYRQKVDTIMAIPRLDEYVRQKMLKKIEDQASAAGMPIDDGSAPVPEPDLDTPGVPNWEIEELKSISDGHILLRDSASDSDYKWSIDLYNSLPRLGTDALHPALMSVGAHKLRLKMLQARDRAKHLHTTMGSENTLDSEAVDLTFAELITEQLAGTPLSVEEQVSRILVVGNSKCKPLKQPGGCTTENLAQLSSVLMKSEVGARLIDDIEVKGELPVATQVLVNQEVEQWSA